MVTTILSMTLFVCRIPSCDGGMRCEKYRDRDREVKSYDRIHDESKRNQGQPIDFITAKLVISCFMTILQDKKTDKNSKYSASKIDFHNNPPLLISFKKLADYSLWTT